MTYTNKSLDLEENAQEATRKERGKQHKYQLKYQNIPYQNQNFISISRKNIVPLGGGEGAGKKIQKTTLGVSVVLSYIIAVVMSSASARESFCRTWVLRW